MTFIPAHHAVVKWALETPLSDDPTTGGIHESVDGSTAASFATAIPTLSGILGYTTLPQGARGLNNSKGFAIGAQGAAYNKRGGVQPTVEVTIRPGSLAALENLKPDPDTGELPYLCIAVVVPGAFTEYYRYCKPGSLAFDFSGGDKGGEITITVPFQAIAYQRGAALTLTDDIRGLGTPLMWHDVRRFTVEDSAGTLIDCRRALMKLSVSVEYNLERKNQRPNWGDHKPLSRTSYALLEHHTAVSGEIGLHERLPDSLFGTLASAQDWGDISIWCSDEAAGADNPKGFFLTLTRAFPSDETRQGAESSAEIDYNVSFTADTFEFDIE